MIRAQKPALAGALAICLAAIAWGFDGVVLTPRLFHLDVAFVVLMVHAIPFLGMCVFLRNELVRWKRFSRKDFVIFFLVALSGGVIGTLAIVKALFLVNFEGLSVVVLLQKLQPVFAITLATILLKERLRKWFVLWAALALAAGYFLTFGFQLPNFGTGPDTNLAILYALFAALAFGSATVFGKMLLQQYSFATVTFYRYGITAVVLFVVLLLNGVFLDQFPQVTFENWLIFLVIGVTTGSGAIFLYYYGLKRVRATVATICELFFPIATIFFDYIVNGNALSPVQWGSVVVMIFAIFQINRLSVQKEIQGNALQS